MKKGREIIILSNGISTHIFSDGKVYGSHIKSARFEHKNGMVDLEITADDIPLEGRENQVEKFRNRIDQFFAKYQPPCGDKTTDETRE